MKTKLYEVVMLCDPLLRRCMATDHPDDPELMEVLFTPIFFVKEPWVTVPRECVMVLKTLGTVTRTPNWIAGLNYR